MEKSSSSQWPPCIALAGADGTGKTTQSKAIVSLLEQRGASVRYVWIRFPWLFSVPFLVYAHLRGYSYHETVGDNHHGYWDFSGSWLMSKVFPWVVLVDTFLVALFKVYTPQGLGRLVVCDRFVVDSLVDLMVGLDDPLFDEHLPGRLFLKLLPRRARVVIVDLDTAIAQERSPELRGDRSQRERRAIYLAIAHRQGLPVVSAEGTIEDTTSRIVAAFTMAPSEG